MSLSSSMFQSLITVALSVTMSLNPFPSHAAECLHSYCWFTFLVYYLQLFKVAFQYILSPLYKWIRPAMIT